jgi:hypothetical protein
MSNTINLRDAVSDVINQVGHENLKALLFNPIEPDDFDEYLARISYHVAPSYLPFMTDDGGIMAFHLWPGRTVSQSPVTYISNDKQEAQFVCDKSTSLPSALWLWVCSYFKDEQEILRQVTNTIAAGIPEAQPVPKVLWTFIDHSPVRWSPVNEFANRAWEVASLGHPFAGIPKLTFRMEAEEALPLLDSFMASHSNVPELLSTFLDCRTKAGLPIQTDEALRVLSSEAWRDFSSHLDGCWRYGGQGVCEWDRTLRNLENLPDVLIDTPFESLIGHPDTYSGDDDEGSELLVAVSEAFRALGDREGELRQLRNAATVSLITSGEYPIELALRIADVCDAISPNSLAAAVARESARVHEQGP